MTTDPAGPFKLSDYPPGAAYADGVDGRTKAWKWKPIDQAFVDECNAKWRLANGIDQAPKKKGKKSARSSQASD